MSRLNQTSKQRGSMSGQANAYAERGAVIIPSDESGFIKTGKSCALSKCLIEDYGYFEASLIKALDTKLADFPEQNRIKNIRDENIRFTAIISLGTYCLQEDIAQSGYKRVIDAFRALDRVYQTSDERSAISYQEACIEVKHDKLLRSGTKVTHVKNYKTYFERCERYFKSLGETKKIWSKKIVPLPVDWRFPGLHSIDQAEQALEDALEAQDLSHESILKALADYRKNRSRLRIGSNPHSNFVIGLLGVVLKGHKIGTNKIDLFVGGSRSVLIEARERLCKLMNVKPDRRAVHSALHSDVCLYSWLEILVGTIPETCMDLHLRNHLTGPSIIEVRRIFAIENLTIRVYAAIALIIAHSRGVGRRHRITILTSFQFVENELKILHPDQEAELFAVNDAIITEALINILNNENYGLNYRNQLVKTFIHEIDISNEHADKFSAFSEKLSEWRLSTIDVKSKIERGVYQRIRREAEERRNASCAAVANDLGLVYRLTEARWREVSIIRNEFDTQCREIQSHQNGLLDQPVRFSVTIPRVRLDGSSIPGSITYDFAVRTARDLAKTVYRTRIIHQRHAPNEYLLEYLGTRNSSDEWTLSSAEAWDCPGESILLAFYRIGLFLSGIESSHGAAKKLRAFIEGSGLDLFEYGFSLFRSCTPRIQWLAKECFKKSVVIIPIMELQHAVSVARAIARCELRGARIGETMQLFLEPGAFTLVSSDPVEIWSFFAAPKGKPPERYLIGKADMDAIVDVLRVMEMNGWAIHSTKATGAIQDKLESQRFIFQRNGHAVNLGVLSCTFATLFWPFGFRSHDLRHGVARFYYNRGVPLSAISQLLHHTVSKATAQEIERQASVTILYATPTHKMTMDMADYLATFEPRD